MDLYHRNRQGSPPAMLYLALSATLTLIGCASPAPPRAPSLKLPQPVRDLTAARIGNAVELHFTAPTNSTDKLQLRGSTVSGQLCRQLPHQPCLPVSPRTSVQINNHNNINSLVTWVDTLPPTLTEGPPQLLTYRVEFFSTANRSAGLSNEAFTASGPAPAPVQNLTASGSRLGTVLQWTPAPGNVILRREDLTPPTAAPSSHTAKRTAPIVWLQTIDTKDLIASAHQSLDTSALPDTPYSYSAERRTNLQIAGHSIEIRSDISPPITFSLLRVYPPPTPSGLTAAGYFTGTPPTFAVDLVWQPVNEAGLITPLAGYILYRERLSPTSEQPGQTVQLNSSPLPQPAFHDTTADPTALYRYSVAAIDIKGNQSPTTSALLQPSSTSSIP